MKLGWRNLVKAILLLTSTSCTAKWFQQESVILDFFFFSQQNYTFLRVLSHVSTLPNCTSVKRLGFYDWDLWFSDFMIDILWLIEIYNWDFIIVVRLGSYYDISPSTRIRHRTGQYDWSTIVANMQSEIFLYRVIGVNRMN